MNDIIHHLHSVIKSKTQQCQVKETLNSGLGLQATENIPSESIIFTEVPLISGQYSWGIVYGYEACHHCLKSLESAQDMARRLANYRGLTLPLPHLITQMSTSHCPECLVAFCSAACREEAIRQYHTAVCTKGDPNHPLSKLDEVWRNMHFPPETISLVMFIKIIGGILQSGAIPPIFEYFYHRIDNGSIAHKLLKQEFVPQLETLRDGLLQLYGSNLHVQRLLDRDTFVRLVGLIGMNGQGIGTSSFAEYCNRIDEANLDPNLKCAINDKIDEIYTKIDEFSGIFTEVEGSGLYELQSKLNHSCDPNVEICFEKGDHTLSVRALRDIKEGEELCISYISPCDLERSRHSRRKLLLDNYTFFCNCSKCKCQSQDPDVTSDEEESGEEMN